MYKRVVLKLSGEALKGNSGFGIDPKTVKSICLEIKDILTLGIELIIIVGAGNLWRGKNASDLGMDRSQADYMGMLGTIMNGLALQDGLESIGVPTRVMSALNVNAVAEPYIRRRALRHLEKGRVVIISGGTGAPYFSTDTAASLRAAELAAECILMAKNGTEGIYDKDPKIFKDAKLYNVITFAEILNKQLGVMDSTAVSMARENHIQIKVFSMNKVGNIKKAIMGEKIGTTVIE
jgi:uridylate kinase